MHLRLWFILFSFIPHEGITIQKPHKESLRSNEQSVGQSVKWTNNILSIQITYSWALRGTYYNWTFQKPNEFAGDAWSEFIIALSKGLILIHHILIHLLFPLLSIQPSPLLLIRQRQIQALDHLIRHRRILPTRRLLGRLPGFPQPCRVNLQVLTSQPIYQH